MERRQDRRIVCQATMVVQRENKGEETSSEVVSADISLGGILFESKEKYVVDEEVVVSVSIPEPLRRSFPFSRLAGKAAVVRVIEIPDKQGIWQVALAFGKDITRLMAVPSHG